MPAALGWLAGGGALALGQRAHERLPGQSAAPESGGAPYNLAGIDILGLGTVVDSLRAVDELVFRQRRCTLRELWAQVDADWPDEALRQQALNLPGRYGSADPGGNGTDANDLARRVSETVARMVLDSRLAGGVRPYPGFFAFGSDIYAVDIPSPDGRRRGDLISHGVGPATTVASCPTSAMAAAAHVAHDLAACGNPLAISLQPGDVAGEGGPRLIEELVRGYFAQGGSHVHFNVVRPEELRAALAHPERYRHLTVRVSGYSARFVAVDPQWQEAIIVRAERGL